MTWRPSICTSTHTHRSGNVEKCRWELFYSCRKEQIAKTFDG